MARRRNPHAPGRRARTGLAATAALALALGCSGPPAPPRNVLLVSIDTLRADHLGAYGYRRDTSPFFDRLARRGVLFMHAYAPAPWTLPSHASLLTGLYPVHHGARGGRLAIAHDVPLLAERLAPLGLATGAVVNAWYLDPEYGFARGFGSYENVPAHLRRGGAAESVTALGLRWLREHRGKPFFLFLHYFDVHSDYNALPRYERLFTHPYDGPIDGTTVQLLAIRRGDVSTNARDRAHLVDLYDAEVRQMDARLEALFDALEEAGALDGTLVVVTADHGEELFDHGSVLHSVTHYDEVLHVPLLVLGPGVPAGLRVREPVSLVDVTPTLLARFGQESAAELDGEDLAPLWLDPTSPRAPRSLFAEADNEGPVPDRLRSVRRGRYKLIVDRAARTVELYDLARDPGEQHNIASRRPQLVGGLEAEIRRGLGRRLEGTPLPPLDAERRRALEALGYLRGHEEAPGAP